MKECPKCHKEYEDDYSFCSFCGVELESKADVMKYVRANKNIIFAIAIVCVVAVCGIGVTISEHQDRLNIKQDIEDYKYQNALKEYMSTPTTSDLKINSDWEMDIERGYVYITGSVTNTSASKTISYFEIEAKFYDRYGNVVDSDWTNDGDDLEPYETRQFEIMHKWDWSYENVKLNVREVN